MEKNSSDEEELEALFAYGAFIIKKGYNWDAGIVIPAEEGREQWQFTYDRDRLMRFYTSSAPRKSRFLAEMPPPESSPDTVGEVPPSESFVSGLAPSNSQPPFLVSSLEDFPPISAAKNKLPRRESRMVAFKNSASAAEDQRAYVQQQEYSPIKLAQFLSKSFKEQDNRVFS